jgi:hypothetical protein
MAMQREKNPQVNVFEPEGNRDVREMLFAVLTEADSFTRTCREEDCFSH